MLKNFLGRGHSPLPRPQSLLGRGYKLGRGYPLLPYQQGVDCNTTNVMQFRVLCE